MKNKWYSKITFLRELFCEHDWRPDYNAYGLTPETCWLPPSLLYLKYCFKCGKNNY